MARCPDCNKFKSMTMEEPSVDLEVEDNGDGFFNVTMQADVELSCEDCGSTMKTGSVEAEQAFEIPKELLDIEEGADPDKKLKACYTLAVAEDATDVIEPSGKKKEWGVRSSFTVMAEHEDSEMSVKVGEFEITGTVVPSNMDDA